MNSFTDLSRSLKRVDRARRDIETRWFLIGAASATAVHILVALWVCAGGQP